MQQKLTQFVDIVQADPAVETVVGFTGGARRPIPASSSSSLKPLGRAQALGRPGDRAAAAASSRRCPAPRLFLQRCRTSASAAAQSNAQYQYTLQGDDLAELYDLGAEARRGAADAARARPTSTPTSSTTACETDLVIDRDTAARLGLTASQIDNTLYDAFGQRQVSTIYNALNQYHVVMEVAPQYWQSPETLKDVYVSTAGGAVGGTQSTNARGRHRRLDGQRHQPARARRDRHRRRAQPRHQLDRPPPAAARASTGVGGQHQPARRWCRSPPSRISPPGTTPLAVNHQGTVRRHHDLVQPAAGRVAERRRPRRSTQAMSRIGMPATIHGSFQGTAQAFQESLEQRAAADPGGAGRRSTSCSACSTRATSTRSRSSRPCRRPASARCWR